VAIEENRMILSIPISLAQKRELVNLFVHPFHKTFYFLKRFTIFLIPQYGKQSPAPSKSWGFWGPFPVFRLDCEK
jgi:hypothetical protein